MSDYYVILFQSVSHALMAEKILKQENIKHKLIPVPRHISSNCGVCIRFHKDQQCSLNDEIKEKFIFNSIRNL